MPAPNKPKLDDSPVLQLKPTKPIEKEPDLPVKYIKEKKSGTRRAVYKVSGIERQDIPQPVFRRLNQNSPNSHLIADLNILKSFMEFSLKLAAQKSRDVDALKEIISSVASRSGVVLTDSEKEQLQTFFVK
eukprot:3644_1